MSIDRLPSGLYRVRIADRGVRGTTGTRRVTIGVYPTKKLAKTALVNTAYRDEGFVFAPPLGGYPSPGSLGNAVRRVAKRAGLELTKLHAARHTTATVLLRQGEDLATVAAVLRHSSSSTTLATYAHEVAGAQRAAVGRAGDERAARRARRNGTPCERPA